MYRIAGGDDGPPSADTTADADQGAGRRRGPTRSRPRSRALHVQKHHGAARARASGHPRRDQAAARQFVRKVSGVTKPKGDVAAAMEDAALQIAHITEHLLADLPTRRQPPKTDPPLRRPEVRKRLGLEPVRAAVGARPSAPRDRPPDASRPAPIHAPTAGVDQRGDARPGTRPVVGGHRRPPFAEGAGSEERVVVLPVRWDATGASSPAVRAWP